jgi:hypothetical protein
MDFGVLSISISRKVARIYFGRNYLFIRRVFLAGDYFSFFRSAVFLLEVLGMFYFLLVFVRSGQRN